MINLTGAAVTATNSDAAILPALRPMTAAGPSLQGLRFRAILIKKNFVTRREVAGREVSNILRLFGFFGQASNPYIRPFTFREPLRLFKP